MASISEAQQRKSRFKDEQIAAMLREAARDAILMVAKRHGVSARTIHALGKWFGSFQLGDERRLKQRQNANAGLKKAVAGRQLELALAAKRLGRRRPDAVMSADRTSKDALAGGKSGSDAWGGAYVLA